MLKRGFTLAEVLITMGVIGVVAALTIPSLSANYQKRVLTTQLQKAYAELSQAGSMALSEEMSSDIDRTRAFRDNNFLQTYLTKSTSCGISSCFAQAYKSQWRGDNDYEPTRFPMTSYSCVRSAAGYSVCFGKLSYDTNLNYGILDVNGTKGPNKMGVDFYRIYFKKRGGLVGYQQELINILENDWNIDF